MIPSNDISLAIELQDTRLIECSFKVNRPFSGGSFDKKLVVASPDKNFSLDVPNRKNIFSTIVRIQFGLFKNLTAKERIRLDAEATGENLDELLHFGMSIGVVVSSPIMPDVDVTPRHLAGVGDGTRTQDNKMRRAMHVEAIKAAYSLATARLLDLSSVSMFGQVHLPLIDADVIYDDMERREKEELGKRNERDVP